MSLRQLRGAGVDERRIAVVYDGVPVPPEPASGERDPGAAGRSIREKGMALAEEAAAAGGRRHRDVRRICEADLPRARALVYLTRSEGLGSGILLGMAYGVTVIASNVGGIPELIDDGVNGILVANEPAGGGGGVRAASIRRWDEPRAPTVMETVHGGAHGRGDAGRLRTGAGA